jgi:NADH:ubiquinone oxidoreductase subunit 5 (subunit L)/multisubunit Na+/H+ antiporter MnhA subunit
MAKLNEAKDFPGIYILQKARIPDKKVKPKRSLMVIVATLFAFFLSITLSFLREHQERMPKKDKMRWREIKKSLRLSLKTLLIFLLIASLLVLFLIFIKYFQDKDHSENKTSYEIISSENN